MKKFLAWIFLLSLAPMAAQATLTVNNSAGTFAVAANDTVTISISSGHTVVVCAFGKGGGATMGTVVDSSGTNTYTIGTPGTLSNFTAACAYSIAIATSITSVTVTPPGTATETGVIVWDITGTGAITVASGGTNGNSYNFNTTTATDGITTNSLTTASTDAMIFGFGREASSGQLTAGTGFTSDVRLNTNSYLGEHKAVTASAAATMTDSLASSLTVASGVALQILPPVVINGVVISNGHPVQSGSSILYQ